MLLSPTRYTIDWLPSLTPTDTDCSRSGSPLRPKTSRPLAGKQKHSDFWAAASQNNGMETVHTFVKTDSRTQKRSQGWVNPTTTTYPYDLRHACGEALSEFFRVLGHTGTYYVQVSISPEHLQLIAVVPFPSFSVYA